MVKKKNPQDAFQTELNEALRRRRVMEGIASPLKEESEESDEDEETDEYDDDDFEDDVPDLSYTLKKPLSRTMVTKKPVEPWDPFKLDEDDEDDDIGGKGSMFLKGQEKKSYTKTKFDPLGMGKLPEARKKSILEEDDSESNGYEEDPILALLREDKPKKVKQQPTPAKRSAARRDLEGEVVTPLRRPMSPDGGVLKRAKSPDGGVLSPKGRKSPKQDALNRAKSPEERIQSPKGRKSQDLEFVKRSHSPEFERGALSPKGRKSPGLSHHSLDHSLSRSGELLKSTEGTMAQRRSLERQKHVVPETRPKTPGSGKSSPELKGILETMKSHDTPDVFSTEPRPRKKNVDKNQSLVDYLLDPSQPKPAPRKTGSKSSSIDSESRKSPTRALSPSATKVEKKADDLKKRRSLSGERQRSFSGGKDDSKKLKSTPARSPSPRGDRQTFSSLPLPSLQSKGRSLTSTSYELPTANEAEVSMDSRTLRKKEKQEMQSGADDLLALFNQSVTGGTVDFEAHIQQKQEEKQQQWTPLDAVVQKMSEQSVQEAQRQRPSRQLLDNVIESVAQHNDSSDQSSTATLPPQKKTPRPKSGKKSYRTPPRNYQGLGSLTMLKELEKKKSDKKSDDVNESTVSSEDIRKQVYMEWLAKREEEAKKKRKEEAEKKKKEEEKAKEEKEDKEKENILVRKKWDEVKMEESKKKAKEKKIEEKKTKEDEEQKAKQKAKSERDAKKRRELMIENAKIQHRADMRKKQEAEKKKKRKEMEQKKDNEKAVKTWMNQRSEQWVEERKKEQKEKKKAEKMEKRDKEEAAEKAEEEYKVWREHKDNQLKQTMRENRMKQRRQRLNIPDEDEENFRPAWSPASKVIPRRR